MNKLLELIIRYLAGNLAMWTVMLPIFIWVFIMISIFEYKNSPKEAISECFEFMKDNVKVFLILSQPVVIIMLINSYVK